MNENSQSAAPQTLPKPEDDGAAAHLAGMRLPSVILPATDGTNVDLSQLAGERTVIYCYPKTGVPGTALPEGWDDIPGAKGCTVETTGFRDHAAELGELGATVYGVSTQTTAYQREMVERLKVPFAILSDANLTFANALNVPIFEAEGETLLKRTTLIVRDGTIEHVIYPVFPADEAASMALEYLRAHR